MIYQDPLAIRSELTQAVNHALELLASGATATACEVEHVDFKEESGRRGRGGVVLVGDPHSTAVADQVANEVACLANTPGGGALVIGIADDGTPIGATVDRDWLRQKVYERVDVAPAVEERHLPDGTRTLVVYVAQSSEPVEDLAGRLRWRVGASCQPVDRSEWWTQQAQGAHDTFAQPTTFTLDDINGAALAALRTIRGQDSGFDPAISMRDYLTQVGAVFPDGFLSQAAALFFRPSAHTCLDLDILDVQGGSITARTPDYAGLSLAEQLAEVIVRLDARDTSVVLPTGFHLAPIRRIPWNTVREAVMNAVVHRDWVPHEPIHLTWVEADSSLDVVSPGGFAGGITADNVLSARYSRNPALADLARALGLVEKRGIGVDRMYRDMVSLGHRHPLLVEETGPTVRTRLVGGEPLRTVMQVQAAINPAIRRQDVRTTMVVFGLMRDGIVTPDLMASLLQLPRPEAEDTLEGASECLIEGTPLIRHYREDIWRPAHALVGIATRNATDLAAARRRGLMKWYRPAGPQVAEVVTGWLQRTDRITSGDLSEVTGFSQQASLSALNKLADEGVISRGTTAGRNAHFVAG